MATINVDDTCTGDGSTDDQAALNAIFGALNASDVVEFGAGKTYAIGGPLTVTSKSTVTINGNGATIFCLAAMPNTAGNWGIHFDRCASFAVSDLTIDGNVANRTGLEVIAHLWYIEATTTSAWTDCVGKNGTCDGWYITARTPDGVYTNSADLTFTDCVSTGNWRNGMSVIAGERITVSGGNYNDNGDTGSGIIGAGVQLEPNAGNLAPVDAVTVDGLTITGNTTGGIGAGNASADVLNSYTIQNCNIYGNGSGVTHYAVDLQGKSGKIVNNAITGATGTRYTIRLPSTTSSSGSFVLRGNTIVGTKVDVNARCIYAQEADQSLYISGNSISGAYYGIVCDQGTGEIVGNTITATTTGVQTGPQAMTLTGNIISAPIPVYINAGSTKLYGNTLTGTTYGIQAANASATVNIIGNDIAVDGDDGNACVRLNAVAVTSVIKNNRMTAGGSGAFFVLDYSVANGGSLTCDYNNYYSDGKWYVSGANKTYATWKAAGFDATSWQVANDSATLKGAGIWVAGARGSDDLPVPLHPDIGAVQDRTAAGRRFGAGGGTL